MIAYLKGKVIDKRKGYLVVEQSGIGYRVWVTATDYESLAKDSEAELSIYHHIREDLDELFGFSKAADLDMFELLLSISGVGPKVALNVLSQTSVANIEQAVSANDPSVLQSVGGIGAKTAERIVVELKNKLEVGEISGVATEGAVRDAFEALEGLGYRATDIRKVLKDISIEGESAENIIREALKNLNR